MSECVGMCRECVGNVSYPWLYIQNNLLHYQGNSMNSLLKHIKREYEKWTKWFFQQGKKF